MLESRVLRAVLCLQHCNNLSQPSTKEAQIFPLITLVRTRPRTEKMWNPRTAILFLGPAQIWRFRLITRAQISTASLFWGALNFNGFDHVRIARTSEVPGALKTKDLTKHCPKQNLKWMNTRQTLQIRLLQHCLDVSHLQKWQQNPIPRKDYHQIFTQTLDEGDFLQTFMKSVVPRRKGVTLWDAQLAISQTSLLSESFSCLHSQFSSVQLSWKAATLV